MGTWNDSAKNFLYVLSVLINPVKERKKITIKRMKLSRLLNKIVVTLFTLNNSVNKLKLPFKEIPSDIKMFLISTCSL